MELSSTITDPFDWPITMPELRTIDNLLRCGICCEFFNIAMILPKCSHNYCSQCIRRYMNYKTQCPACNTPAIEGEIRNNKVLDEIVKNFIQVRPHVLKLCKGQGGQRSETVSEKVTPARTRKNTRKTPKSGASDTSLTPGTVLAVQETSRYFTTETPKRPHKSDPDTPLNRSNEENINPASSEDVDVVILDDEPPQSTSSPSSSKSPPAPAPAPAPTRSDKSSCPVCGVFVAIKHINTHLDLCLRRSSEKPAKRGAEKRKPLPKLVYNIMSDKELRRKLKEYKLSSQGTRKELIRRIQEYTVLYNAQCDSDDPTPVEDVIKYYERMERIRTKPLQKSSTQAFKLKIEKGQTEEDILNSQKEYLKHHNKQFEDLLKNAKQTMKKRKTKPNTVEESAASNSETAASSSETETECKTDKGVTSGESSSEEPTAIVNSKEIVSSDEIQGSDLQESALNSEHKTEVSVSTSVTKTDSVSCEPVEAEEKLPVMDTEKCENGIVTEQPDMTGNNDREGSLQTSSESERNIIQNESVPAEINEVCDGPLEQGPSIVSGGRNVNSESQVVDHVTGQSCQMPCELMDQTSPVFGRDAFMACRVDDDRNSSSQGQQDVVTNSDKKTVKSKLRRKRKTVLEQLEADLSSKTEEWAKRASKRNKKA